MTRATGKCYMCKSFICLFCSLLTPGCPRVKKCLPIAGSQENARFGADVHNLNFRRGREGFSENFVRNMFFLIFCPLWKEAFLRAVEVPVSAENSLLM